MGVLDIRVEGDPVLRQRAKRVRRVDGQVRALIADMFETMHAANGVGLAAPQVGISLRVVVVEIPPDMEDEPAAGVKLAFINPEIIRARGEEVGEEGCLSIPGFVGMVRRAAEVTVRGLDAEGNPCQVKGKGLLARALQHEIDHLDGVLFIDRVEPGTLRRVDSSERELAATPEEASG